MLRKSHSQTSLHLFSPALRTFINMEYKLVVLANKIDFISLEKAFSPLYSKTETMKWKMWSILMKHQWLFNRVNGRLKTFFVNYVIAPNWRKKRSMLEFPQHSFKQLYQQYIKNKV